MLLLNVVSIYVSIHALKCGILKNDFVVNLIECGMAKDMFLSNNFIIKYLTNFIITFYKFIYNI